MHRFVAPSSPQSIMHDEQVTVAAYNALRHFTGVDHHGYDIKSMAMWRSLRVMLAHSWKHSERGDWVTSGGNFAPGDRVSDGPGGLLLHPNRGAHDHTATSVRADADNYGRARHGSASVHGEAQYALVLLRHTGGNLHCH